MFAGGPVAGSITPVVAGLVNQPGGFCGGVIIAETTAATGAVLLLVLPMKRRVST